MYVSLQEILADELGEDIKNVYTIHLKHSQWRKIFTLISVKMMRNEQMNILQTVNLNLFVGFKQYAESV